MNVPVDETAFTNAGLVFKQVKDGSDVVIGYRFIVDKRDDVVKASVADGQMIVYPERSSAHKALIVQLGLNAS